MEFVEEIEEAECEDRARLSKSCRKPPNAKELDTMGDGGTRSCTIAIFDTNCRDAGNVKEIEFNRAGWHCARFSGGVTKLMGGAKVE